MAETKSLLKTRTTKSGTVGSNPTHSANLDFLIPIVLNKKIPGELAEWLKARAWKACIG